MARPSTRRRVHEAVLAIARERRVASITMEGIAARAGAGKQTLYRTWSSTGAILFDALLAESEDEDGVVSVPDSGDLQADLELLLQGMVDELCEPAREQLLRGVVAELQSDEALAAEYRERLLAPQLAAIAERFRRAGVEEASGAAELLVGAVLHRWLLRSGDLDRTWIRAHAARMVRAVR